MGEYEFLHITHPEVVAEEFDHPNEEVITVERKIAYLRPIWNELYRKTLPSLARSKAPSQPHWPVHLDHCFARIIFDAVIGNSTQASDVSPVPWTDRIGAPAIKNMHPQQIEECIELGEAIAQGKVNLVELDRQSLAVRGKFAKGEKRKREDSSTAQSPTGKKPKSTTSSKPKSKSSHQPDIRTSMGHPPTPPKSSSPPPSAPAAQPSPSVSSKIQLHPTLTPFRKRVLLALCQVPPGHYTSYLALSNHLHSSPRAVGNALRNNPFAPEAPCHRVVAADGGIGGFGGGWGVQGRHNMEKVRLLRGEGVVVEGDGARVGGKVWEGFL